MKGQGKGKGKAVKEKVRTGSGSGGGAEAEAEASAAVGAEGGGERGQGEKMTEMEMKAAREAVLARQKDEDRDMLRREYPDLDEEVCVLPPTTITHESLPPIASLFVPLSFPPSHRTWPSLSIAVRGSAGVPCTCGTPSPLS